LGVLVVIDAVLPEIKVLTQNLNGGHLLENQWSCHSFCGGDLY